MKRSHIIALSGISCALTLICVVCSIYVEFMTLTFAVLAAICVSIPLTQNYWIGGILSYVASSILAFLIGNINSLPFILFFGAYALIQWLLEQKLYTRIKNKMIRFSAGYLIKLAYFEGVIAIFWFLFNALIPTLILFGKTIKLTYLIIALAGIPFFLIYDLMMHLLFKNFTILIKRVTCKMSKTTTSDDVMYNSEKNEKHNNALDIFGDTNSKMQDNKSYDNVIEKQNSDENNKENNIDNKDNSSEN